MKATEEKSRIRTGSVILRVRIRQGSETLTVTMRHLLVLTLEGAVLAVPAVGAEARSVGAHAVL